MVSEVEKYQYLCGSICISQEIKEGLLKKDMTDMEKNQEVLDKIKIHCEEYQIAEKDTTDYRYYTVTGCLQKDHVLFDQTKFDYLMIMAISGL